VTTASAVSATDKGAATAVLTAQLTVLDKQRALNKCLAASPHKNTPCIRQKALSLATVAGQQIKLVQAAIDGSERECVATVAQLELDYLRIWRNGALALFHNQRKKAKRLFVSSLKIDVAQQKVQPACFADVLAG
jgi:hypothetical protein